jgi:integrase
LGDGPGRRQSELDVQAFLRHSPLRVPPPDILARRLHRATPYLYSTEEIFTLLAVTTTLCGSHRKATDQTLIGLLAATGMLVGEAIGLDRNDFDAICGALTIRNRKFGKSRELPLHPSTIAALAAAPIVLASRRTSLPCSSRQRARGCKPRSAACRLRLHDLRHSFAVNTILDAYRDDDDPGARLAILSTYLGHINPVHTYWYLSVSPELLKLAGDRLERHLGGDA